MNAAHYHLVLNHLPIIFPIVGVLVLLGGFIFRSVIVRRVAFAIFIAGALLTFPAFQSGEGAEEVVEEMAGVNEAAMETHEDLAKQFAIFSYVLGGLSVGAMWLSVKNHRLESISGWVILAFAAITLYNAQQTGTSGGAIRHPEIGAQFQGGGEGGEGGENGEEGEEGEENE